MSKRTVVRRPATKKSVAEKPIDKKRPEDPVEKDWQSMFVLAEHWQSDLIFFLDELNFFRSLVDKYFMWLIDEKNIEKTRRLAAELIAFDKRRTALAQELSHHLSQLTDLIQNPFAQNGQESRDAHVELEKSMVEFAKEFKTLKKNLFQLTEEVIESEKAQHLLGS